jgi:DNA-binding NarL/FixJ family response regulator
MSESEQPGHLRVLIADERQDRLDYVTNVVTALGHVVIAEATDIGMIAALTSDQLPDVAIVCLDDSSDHALHVIRQIVRESACPVIALLDIEDADFINQAAQIGIFAYIVNGELRTTPKRLRHRPSSVCRIPRPGRRVHPSRHHRTRQRHPHGTPSHRRASRL